MPRDRNLNKQGPFLRFGNPNGGLGQKLLKSTSDFRTFSDYAPIVIWATDPSGQCTYLSRFWRQLTGRDPILDVGSGWRNALHPKDRPRAAKDLVDAVRTRGICEGEYRVRHTSGHYRWVLFHGVPYFRDDESNHYAGHMGTGVDITVRKNREAERIRIHDSLLLGQEAERKRIARELHDNIGQKLALLGVTLSEIEQLSKSASEAVRKKLREVRDCVDTIASETHLISHNLHPAMLTQLGLVPALRRLCKEYSTRKQLTVEFNENQVSADLPQDVAAALFRVAQECLANTAKHSGAPVARLELLQNQSELQLIVADSGRGFDPKQESVPNGLGLISVRERVRMIGGEIEIHAAPLLGAEIRVRVPTVWRARQAAAS